MKIVTIVGARPQFIKAATVSRQLNNHPDITEIIIHTGQHFDKSMSEVFFQEMDIPSPHYYLSINSLSHGKMTGRMLEKIEEVLLLEKPDYVLVYGDTNSTLAGALAASKLSVPIIHVEAGLRSFNMKMPEEINRIVTDRLSHTLCCPTETAVNNLMNEGFNNFSSEIILTGDVMEDAALFYASRIKNANILDQLPADIKSYYLCTLHRQENTDDPIKLASIVSALNELNRETPVLLPLHPRTQQALERNAIDLNVFLLPPLGYLDMLHLVMHAKMVITDSGGLQKEAYFFDKYCVTLRNETEWTELVSEGYNQLTGSSSEAILEAVKYFQDRQFHKLSSLYGGGKASKKILNYLESKL